MTYNFSPSSKLGTIVIAVIAALAIIALGMQTPFVKNYLAETAKTAVSEKITDQAERLAAVEKQVAQNNEQLATNTEALGIQKDKMETMHTELEATKETVGHIVINDLPRLDQLAADVAQNKENIATNTIKADDANAAATKAFETATAADAKATEALKTATEAKTIAQRAERKVNDLAKELEKVKMLALKLFEIVRNIIPPNGPLKIGSAYHVGDNDVPLYVILTDYNTPVEDSDALVKSSLSRQPTKRDVPFRDTVLNTSQYDFSCAVKKPFIAQPPMAREKTVNVAEGAGQKGETKNIGVKINLTIKGQACMPKPNEYVITHVLCAVDDLKGCTMSRFDAVIDGKKVSIKNITVPVAKQQGIN